MKIENIQDRDSTFNADPSKYRISRSGGRVKTAGASLQVIYDAADPLMQNPTCADAAFEANRNFATLKSNPTELIMRAFFPQDTRAIKTAMGGLGVYRPTIKTDQGPAGNFAPFYISENGSQLSVIIINEQGVAIVEAFLQERLMQAQLPDDSQDEITNAVAQVQEAYQAGDYRIAHDGIMQLRSLGDLYGIETTRRAGVGRGEFFFCRPVRTEVPIRIGNELLAEISSKTEEIVGRIEHLAFLAKGYVKQGYSIEQACEMARESGESASLKEEGTGLLYFQPDVLIRSDGSFEIEKVNFPDLGMFITQVHTTAENTALAPVVAMNERIRDEVVERIIAEIPGDTISIITRPEVLENTEDTLEHFEIMALQEKLDECGKNIRVISVDELVDNSDLRSDPSLLLNVSTASTAYERLLYLYANNEAVCYPSPFIRLFEKEATTFPRNVISGQILDKFLEIIKPTALDKPKGIYEKGRLIDQALMRGGTTDDIIYFSVPGVNSQQIPTFRYDPKSFFEVYKTVSKLREAGQDVNQLVATSVPFKPEDAIMQGQDGPRMAVFRFMFTKQ